MQKVAALSWPICGAILLIIPTAFIIGGLTGHPPAWSFLKNPVVLLGSLGGALLGNLWSLVHLELVKGMPSILRIEIAGKVSAILVALVAGGLGSILVGYAFVENFAAR